MKGAKPNLIGIAGGKATGRIPAPPGGLNNHGAAEWKRVAPVLQQRGMLGAPILASLEAYCRAVGLSREYTAMMDRDGHVIETERGQQSHPAFKMLMGAMREARLLAAELGLTRARGNDKAKGQGDGWDADLLA